MNYCNSCAYFMYDDEYGDYICSADIDEDEFYRLTNDPRGSCPYYRGGDEYTIVRKQN